MLILPELRVIEAHELLLEELVVADNAEGSAYYGDRVQQGGVFVSVDTDQTGVDASRAQDILYSNGGHSASSPRTM